MYKVKVAFSSEMRKKALNAKRAPGRNF